MQPTQSISLTTLSPDGTETKVSIPISTIKKIIELKGYGARLYIMENTNESQTQLDVTESANEVKSLIISLK